MFGQAFLWPLRTTGILLIGAYTLVGFYLLQWVGSDEFVTVLLMAFASPVWFLLVGSLAQHAQRMLAHTARGLIGERVPEETDLNPFRSTMALKLFVLLVLVTIFGGVNGPQMTPWLVLVMAVFPLLWLGATLEGSVFSGLHPSRLRHLLRGLQFHYLIVVGLLSGSVGWLVYGLIWQQSLVALVTGAYVFLLANVLCGLVLFHRRLQLDLYTERSPEQLAAEETMAESRAFEDLMVELHRLCSVGRVGVAHAKLQDYIGDQAPTLDPLVHERLQQFHDVRLRLEHAVHYLQRLADRGELRKAWALLKESLELDERFRPLNDETLLALTRVADSEDVVLVNELLQDFADAYPESQVIAEAQFRRARFCIELLDDGATGIGLLKEIRAQHPAFAASEEFKHYMQRLRPSQGG